MPGSSQILDTHLMAMWSKALAATDCMLSLTTAWVRIPAYVCEKVASDLELGGVFRRVLRFPPLLTQLASHELATIWHTCDEIPNPNLHQ